MSDQIPDPKRAAILVVDDSKVIRVALQRILQGQNTVYEGADGEQALELLQQYPDIGLVLTDLSMPGIDGQDLLLRIRDGVDEVPTDLPVVIVTGQESDEAASDEWRSLGANAVLMKPFVPTRVREVVAELLPPPPAPEPAPPAETAPDSAENQALRDEVERLRRELMLRQQSSNEREAKQELERLRNALGEARDESTAAFQRAEEREGEIESLQARLQETEAAMAEAQASAAEAETIRAQAEEREHELEALRTRVEELEADSNASPVEANSASETLRTRLHELEAENVRLDHELVDLERQREEEQTELKVARGEAERLRRERNQQCERAAAAEKAQAEAEQRCTDSQDSASDLGDRLVARERELAEAQQRNQDLRGRIRDLEHALTGHSTTAAAEPMSEPSRGEPVKAEPGDRPRASLFDAKPARLGRRRWFRLAFVGVLAVIVVLGVAIYLRGA
ncbi:response regulator [Thioalkalivibrio sp. ALMg11]|uniref:response regulator n=1 Tax=Thioalkalivibrio sp. ALMg11 TaxID=1158165 RepID=UPI0003752276|nr:response regulator [Thioalkalivibrio sp. ALMg11]